MTKLINILVNLITTKFYKEIPRKIQARLDKNNSAIVRSQVHDLCENKSIKLDSFCEEINGSINDLAKQIVQEINDIIKDNADHKSNEMGGGANIHLLVFLCLLVKPRFTVETGVASGISSLAILYTLNTIGKGELFSSDLPYIRVKNSKSKIGYLVPQRFHGAWTLKKEGDESNLKELKFLNKKIDIFHYDSDKSYEGRIRTWRKIKQYLHKDSFIIFDDINDNQMFFDLIEGEKYKEIIIKTENKFVGIAYHEKNTYMSA